MTDTLTSTPNDASRSDLVERPEQLPIRGTVIRAGSFSVRLDTRAVWVCCVLGALTVVIGLWSISVGDFPIPISEVVATLLGNPTDDSEFIVGTLRLPRVLVGAGVGAAFGMSGAIFQSLVRNPLGSPDIIGFTAGASLGAVTTIVVLDASAFGVSVGAVLGGLISALAVYLLAWKRGVQAYRLVLVGIGAGFAISAAIDYMITRAEIYDVQRATVWLTGSLNGRSWDDVRIVFLALLVLGPLAILMQRNLDRLDLGDDTAAGLGVDVGRAKLSLVLVGVLLAALGVAAAGPIAFVAFVAGPIARRLVSSPRACIVPAAFVGALVTVVADLAARRVLAPTELPVGIMTALIGAPYLLWLLSRQARTGLL
ncbi:FecCD family ABC transporter permease [Ilumatobacter nonamiensis]|uniref:FecCD family ABC transporter permease n=1 Tax=Ilumatobacter nonamiensis TaxID=467093 RepID=UPI00034BD365|nr:iron chelate uptake ABC transporter family permease subunit [Ilumatobacter nonamiensis]